MPRVNRSLTRRALAATAALALVWTGSAATATDTDTTHESASDDAVLAPSPQPLAIADRLDQEELFAHVEQFQTIADENGGNRAAGTPGYDASIDYVEEQLVDAGYETWRQDFPFTYTEVLSDEVTQVAPQERDLPHTVLDGSPGTDGPIEADIVAPVQSLGCTAEAYDGVEAEGAIALVSRGECTFGEKTLAAAEAGAVGVVIHNNTDGDIAGTLGPNQPEFIPTVGVTQALGEELLADFEAGPVTIGMDLEILVEERITQNLFAETSYGDPDDTIVIGAHTDSVQAGPGIHDNASGTTNVLGVALALENRPITNKVRFAWWGAEELGLIGADHYVSELSADELAQIKAYINLDMVAPLDEQNTFGVLDDPMAGQMPGVLTDALEAQDHDWGPAGYAGNSDYQPFVDAGIPSTGLLAYYDENYHTVDDDLSNVSATSLYNGTVASATLVEALADDISLAAPRPDPSVGRVGGTDRYDTAALLAERSRSSDVVFLASGQDFPDAVSGASIAAAGGYPVLLTRGEALTQRTAAQITALDPDVVLVLGGSAAISPDVVDAVADLGPEVEVLEGATRYGTAALLALQNLPITNSPDRLYVATGQSYQDVLTASALAGSQSEPLFLVKQDAIPQETLEVMSLFSPAEIVVLGGEDAVSDDVVTALEEFAPTTRLEGATRFHTAAAVAEEFTRHGVVWLASGDDYPDALASAAVAGQRPAPVLLTDDESLPQATIAALTELAPHTVVVSGGTEAVDDSVLEEVEALIGVAPQSAPAGGPEPDVADEGHATR